LVATAIVSHRRGMSFGPARTSPELVELVHH